jgi:predicted alpha/beta hydrolase
MLQNCPFGLHSCRRRRRPSICTIAEMEVAMQTESSLAADKPFSLEQPELLAEDTFALGARLFVPKQPALGTVIMHGATAVPAGYYRRFAEFLAHHGLRVLTYDYRGVGASRPKALRGFRASMSDWAKLDAEAAHALVRRRFPGEPVASVGHSFGGQLIGLIDAAREVRGSLLVGSQLGYFGHWGALDRLRLGLIWRALVPTLTASFGYLPAQMGLGEDLPRGVANEWAKWCSSPEYLISHEPEARARFARFDRPLLFYSFTDDKFAPRRAVDALIANLPNARLEQRRIDPRDFGGASIGHFGFFKPRFEQTLWLDALHFLAGVLTADDAVRA